MTCIFKLKSTSLKNSVIKRGPQNQKYLNNSENKTNIHCVTVN